MKIFKELRQEREKNKQNMSVISRLLETIFCNKDLEEEEIDFLLDEYPQEMQKISMQQNFKAKFSAKIGFKV